MYPSGLSYSKHLEGSFLLHYTISIGNQPDNDVDRQCNYWWMELARTSKWWVISSEWYYRHKSCKIPSFDRSAGLYISKDCILDPGSAAQGLLLRRSIVSPHVLLLSQLSVCLWMSPNQLIDFFCFLLKMTQTDSWKNINFEYYGGGVIKYGNLGFCSSSFRLVFKILRSLQGSLIDYCSICITNLNPVSIEGFDKD